MGLPKITIDFKIKGTTAVKRSARGIVALIVKDDTNKAFSNRVYTSIDQLVEGDFSSENKEIIKQTFMGCPSRIIVERINTDEEYTQALAKLKNKKWNYLAVPGIKADDVQAIATWVTSQRTNDKKTFKAVLPNAVCDHEGIINFSTSGIKVNEKDTPYTASQYTGRIAGILAGLPFTRSATYYDLNEVESIQESTDPDGDIDAGKLILIHDGAKVKIGRGINSLTTASATKGEEFKKIKIVDALDLMRDDIQSTFEGSYIGKIINSYDNKVLLLAAINAYFEELEKMDVLDPSYDNKGFIDLEAQKLYLSSKGIDVDSMKDMEIKQYNTGSQVFINAKVKFLDAMEDLKMEIHM